ncbi:MAG: NADH-quinone oxidoreductase subunit NuoE [Candidatus Margulisiibacteriota bacterium]|jgi:NADH-quinone oxidoreductase subunit E/NADP-reducing hydrogenase subunit HndA
MTEKTSVLKKYIAETRGKENPESYLIAVLHKAQELFGYLPVEVMNVVSEEMNIPTAHIWGVATFYHFFSLKPKGKHVISVCLGTACYVKGADDILKKLKDELKINVGGTTEDKLFTLQEARCLGACGLAPVIMIDDKIYGDLTAKKVAEIIKNYRKAAQPK